MLLTIVSFNVNGLRNNLKRKTIFHFLKMKKFDFILLQETHSNQTDEKLWKCEWGGDIFYSHGTNHCNGVAILVKNLLNTNKQLHMLIKQAEYCLSKLNLTTKSLSSAMSMHPQRTNQLFLTPFFQQS